MDVEDSPDGGPSTSQDDENENNSNLLNNDNIDKNNVVIQDDGSIIVFGEIYVPPPSKPALTFDTTGPRLIITHIVNENFKSYAGVQTLGPFHKVRLLLQ